MDIRSEINPLLSIMGEDLEEIVNSTVLIHLDRAEQFFQKAQSLKDDQYYNDVIYRTNQAYEGMLEIAYVVLTDGGDEGECNLTTYQLEDFFEEKKIFNRRVRITFTLYRRLWRNPSVHDSALFFKKDDAFLALVYVSAFIYILLNQILEYRSTIKSIRISVLEEVLDDHYEDKEVDEDIVIEWLRFFHMFSEEDIIAGDNMAQIIGAIKGYLESKMRGLEIITHYKGIDVLGYQPDIIIKYNDNMLILEVKNEYTKEKLEFGYKQIKDYLDRSEVKQGILYFYTDDKNANYEIDSECMQDKEIITLIPKQNNK